MCLFKSKSNLGKKLNGSPGKGEKKKVKYVWLSSHKAIFTITNEQRQDMDLEVA